MILKVSKSRGRQLTAASKARLVAMPLFERERRELVRGGYSDPTAEDVARIARAEANRLTAAVGPTASCRKGVLGYGLRRSARAAASATSSRVTRTATRQPAAWRSWVIRSGTARTSYSPSAPTRSASGAWKRCGASL